MKIKSNEVEAANVEQHGLVELDSSQILKLLSSHHLGRLAFAHESWPVIVPVNYAFEEPAIVVRTAPGAKLTSAPFHAVAFEVDDSDPEGQWGWSVLAQGPAFDITNGIDERSQFLRGLFIEPAAPGVKDRWLVISATHISGRAFGDIPRFPEPHTGERSR